MCGHEKDGAGVPDLKPCPNCGALGWVYPCSECGNQLWDYVIVSTMGERNWLAENEEHAREQHVDAFPEEEILTVRRDPPEE